MLTYLALATALAHVPVVHRPLPVVAINAHGPARSRSAVMLQQPRTPTAATSGPSAWLRNLRKLAVAAAGGAASSLVVGATPTCAPDAMAAGPYTQPPKPSQVRKARAKKSGSNSGLATIALAGGVTYWSMRIAKVEDEEEQDRIKTETENMERLSKEFTDIDDDVVVRTRHQQHTLPGSVRACFAAWRPRSRRGAPRRVAPPASLSQATGACPVWTLVPLQRGTGLRQATARVTVARVGAGSARAATAVARWPQRCEARWRVRVRCTPLLPVAAARRMGGWDARRHRLASAHHACTSRPLACMH